MRRSARFFPLLLALAFARPAAAQEDGPVKMTPEFALCFPVTLMNKHDVTVKYPVMINPVTTLEPGMILRVIYVPPIQNQSEDLVLAHKGSIEQAYSRDTASGDAGQAKLPPEIAHEIERQQRRVWQVPNNFVLAIAQYPTDDMHIIYSTPAPEKGLFAKKAELHDTSFSFFDGLFIGSPDGRVRVIAVEKESHADQAGVKPGDEIVAVGGTPMRGGDLGFFANTFAAVKKAAAENEASSYAMTVRTGDAAPRTAAFPMPQKLKNDLMEGFK